MEREIIKHNGKEYVINDPKLETIYAIEFINDDKILKVFKKENKKPTQYSVNDTIDSKRDILNCLSQMQTQLFTEENTRKLYNFVDMRYKVLLRKLELTKSKENIKKIARISNGLIWDANTIIHSKNSRKELAKLKVEESLMKAMLPRAITKSIQAEI